MTKKYEGFFNIEKLKKPNIILVAARHNKRESLDQERPDSIDAARSRLNIALHGPQSAREVAELAKSLMKKAGITPRAGAVLAIELVFSLKTGMGIDSEAFFSDCLQWAANRFGGIENILVADIHNDESAPHAHVLILPLVNGRLNGSDLVGVGEVYAGHYRSFFAEVGATYGIERPPALLKGR